MITCKNSDCIALQRHTSLVEERHTSLVEERHTLLAEKGRRGG